MSRKSKKNTAAVATQASEILVSGLAEMTTELKAKKKLVKKMDALKEWEEATKVKNPQYVMGSLRAATEDDLAIVGHTHGFVCLIKCEVCGEERLVNKQDAFQSRTCKACKKKASKAKAKARATAKKLAGLSKEDIQAQINALNAQLGIKAA
jgi:hypothetical protein